MTTPGEPRRGGWEPKPPPPPTGPIGVRATAAVPAPAPPAPAATPAPQVVGAADTAAAGRPAAAPPPAARAAVTSPAPPSGPPVMEPGGGPPPPEPQWRARRHRRLHRLRVGLHAAPVQALDQLQLRRESVGLLLGRGRAGEPVTIRLFQPRPTRVVLIGDPWLAKLLTFRALRFGTRAVVLTAETGGWIELGRRATGRTDRVAVQAPEAEVSTTASADTPLLRVAGAGRSAGGALPDWHTLLTVLPPATVTDLAIRPDRAEQLRAADVVLAQRLSPPATAAVAAVLGLAQHVSQAQPTLPDGVLAVMAGSGVHYAWVDPTSAEREALSQSA